MPRHPRVAGKTGRGNGDWEKGDLTTGLESGEEEMGLGHLIGQAPPCTVPSGRCWTQLWAACLGRRFALRSREGHVLLTQLSQVNEGPEGGGFRGVGAGVGDSSSTHHQIFPALSGAQSFIFSFIYIQIKYPLSKFRSRMQSRSHFPNRTWLSRAQLSVARPLVCPDPFPNCGVGSSSPTSFVWSFSCLPAAIPCPGGEALSLDTIIRSCHHGDCWNAPPLHPKKASKVPVTVATNSGSSARSPAAPCHVDRGRAKRN